MLLHENVSIFSSINGSNLVYLDIELAKKSNPRSSFLQFVTILC